MSAKPTNDELSPSAVQSLREQASRQILALYEVAERSNNPAIQASAIEGAEAERRHLHRQEERISPRTAWIYCFFIWVAAIAASWFATINYATPLGIRISGVVFTGSIIASFICLTVARIISASDLVDFLRSVWEKCIPWGGLSSNSAKSSTKVQLPGSPQPTLLLPRTSATQASTNNSLPCVTAEEETNTGDL
jgi:hypothetical protein